MNTGERIKKLRKTLDLTQQKFGERIGIKGNTVAQYELGRSKPVDSVFSLICREFNVNETWLRTGEGDMFIELDMEDQLMEWSAKVLSGRDSKFKKQFVTMLMSLSENEWELLEKKARELVENLDKKEKD